ncbi:hypothetical protein GCM10018987_34600 [Streptomyces cremeus]
MGLPVWVSRVRHAVRPVHKLVAEVSGWIPSSSVFVGVLGHLHWTHIPLPTPLKACTVPGLVRVGGSGGRFAERVRGGCVPKVGHIDAGVSYF